MIIKLIKLARLIPSIAEQLYKIAGVKDEAIKKFPQYERQINELSDKGVADSFLFSAVNLLDKHNKPKQKTELEKEKKEQEAAEKEGRVYQPPERKPYTVDEVYEIIMKKQNGEKSNSLMNTVLAQFPEYADKIEELSKIFPKTYLIWACNQLKDKQPYHEVISMLQSYEKYKPRLEDKELYHYKTLGDLRGAIESLSETSITEENLKYDMLVNNEDISIVVPKNKEAAIYFGKNTKWCTAATVSENMFMDYSLMNYQLYIVTNKKSNPRKEPLAKIQYGINSNRKILINDANDKEITEEDVESYYGEETYNIINQVINNYHAKNPETEARSRFNNYTLEDLEEDLVAGNKDIIRKYINKIARLPDENALKVIFHHNDDIKKLFSSNNDYREFLSNIRMSEKLSLEFVNSILERLDLLDLMSLIFRNHFPIHNEYMIAAINSIESKMSGLESVVLNNMSYFIKNKNQDKVISDVTFKLFLKMLPNLNNNISGTFIYEFISLFLHNCPIDQKQIDLISKLKIKDHPSGINRTGQVNIYNEVKFNSKIKEDTILYIIEEVICNDIINHIKSLEDLRDDRDQYIYRVGIFLMSLIRCINEVLEHRKNNFIVNIHEQIISKIKEVLDYVLSLNINLLPKDKEELLAKIKFPLNNNLSRIHINSKLKERGRMTPSTHRSSPALTQEELENLDKEFDQMYSVIENHPLIQLTEEERIKMDEESFQD